ncbi:hypothetical protein [Rothia nasisuis]|uniref:hypothetical protein n=2 Tax=Rothia nasisuis TaxID=2109647 RepID=UPI001F3C5963|nr:hypothetical protein [Rothia nasisuis]
MTALTGQAKAQPKDITLYCYIYKYNGIVLYMFVMTVDQRNSTQTGIDLIPQLHRDLSNNSSITAPLREFQRTAGDEVQAVFDNPHNLLTTTRVLARQGSWHIGIGSGIVNQPLPSEARAGSGQAYRNARYAVERSKKSPGHIAFEGRSRFAPLIEASLQLVMGLEEDRNDTWQSMGELYDRGLSQQAIAEQCGTYQSAVSRALKRGRWHETRKILKELAHLLEEEL